MIRQDVSVTLADGVNRSDPESPVPLLPISMPEGLTALHFGAWC